MEKISKWDHYHNKPKTIQRILIVKDKNCDKSKLVFKSVKEINGIPNANIKKKSLPSRYHTSSIFYDQSAENINHSQVPTKKKTALFFPFSDQAINHPSKKMELWFSGYKTGKTLKKKMRVRQEKNPKG